MGGEVGRVRRHFPCTLGRLTSIAQDWVDIVLLTENGPRRSQSLWNPRQLGPTVNLAI
jgi:hypothetical protein